MNNFSFDLAYCPKCKNYVKYNVSSKMVKNRCGLGEYVSRRDTARCANCNKIVRVETIEQGNEDFKNRAYEEAFCRGYN